MAVKLKRRASERGTALFIVVMVVTLLTAIGVFAVHATSMAQAASGYSRRAAAAMHVAEFGMLAVASDLAGKESEYHKLATSRDGDDAPIEDCLANRGLATKSATCHVVDVAGARNFLPGPVASDPTGQVFGVLGRDATMLAGFRVEMHDVVQAPVVQAGNAASGSAIKTDTWQAAFTATGAILPAFAGVDTCTEDATRASETLTLRGVVVYTTTN